MRAILFAYGLWCVAAVVAVTCCYLRHVRRNKP